MNTRHITSDPLFDADGAPGGTAPPEANPSNNGHGSSEPPPPGSVSSAAVPPNLGADDDAIAESTVCLRNAEQLLAKPLPLPPEVDRDEINWVAHSRQPDLPGIVQTRHDFLWQEKFGEQQSALTHLGEVMETNHAGLRARHKRLAAEQRRMSPHKEKQEEKDPWTPLDRLTAAALFLFSIIMLVVDINTVAQVLYSSGVPGFESLERCYLFSALPLVFAIVLHGVAHLWKLELDRKMFTGTVCTLGLILGVIWMFLFSRTFNGMVASPAEVINSLLSSGATSAGSGAWLIFVSLAAQSCLAAGCWLLIEHIARSHRFCIRVDNPAYMKTQKQIDQLLQVMERQAKILGVVLGRIETLKKGHADYLLRAAIMLEMAEAATSFQKQAFSIFHNQPQPNNKQ